MSTLINVAAARAVRPAQIAILMTLGVVLLYLVAVALGAAGRLGAFRSPGVIVLYALVIPATVPLILLCRRLAGLARDQTLLTVAVVTATASVLDGNALVWFPSLYGGYAAGAGAAIVWGIAVALVLGVTMNRP